MRGTTINTILTGSYILPIRARVTFGRAPERGVIQPNFVVRRGLREKLSKVICDHCYLCNECKSAPLDEHVKKFVTSSTSTKETQLRSQSVPTKLSRQMKIKIPYSSAAMLCLKSYTHLSSRHPLGHDIPSSLLINTIPIRNPLSSSIIPR